MQKMTFGASVGCSRHLTRDLAKIKDLSGVEVLRHLDVRAPDPPIVRQLQREITAVLRAQPAAETVLLRESVARLAEHEIKRRQSVVPVVVPGQNEKFTARWGVGALVARQGQLVGRLEALAIGLRGSETGRPDRRP